MFRDLILMFLAERGQSMTSRKLYRAIRRSGACASYQAVHKQLKMLIEEGEVIKCNHVEYSINPEWIEAFRGFYDIMERNQRFRCRLKGVDSDCVVRKQRLNRAI